MSAHQHLRPTSGNALKAVGAAQGVGGQSKADSQHFPAAPDNTQAKQAATLAARAALAGVTLHALKDECGRREWIACRWHLTRAFRSLQELETWLDLIGAPK